MLDLTGDVYGNWKVIKEVKHTYDSQNHKRRNWLLECQCTNKNQKVFMQNFIRFGNIPQHCGCGNNIFYAFNLKDKEYGRWKIIDKAEYRTNPKGKKIAYVLCECQCEKHIVREVAWDSLKKGRSQSCGCIHKELTKKLGKESLRWNYEKQRKTIESKGYKLLTTEEEWKIQHEINKINPVKILVKITCKCGNPIHRAFDKILHREHCLCRECLSEIRSSKMIGENNPMYGMCDELHPNYNFNLSDEEREIKRMYPEYKEWRSKVYEKDNYTCKLCGNTKSGIFNAHHLDGWNWAKEKRFEIYNGITLCEDCHKNFHALYGYGDNTKEQFEEFKQNQEKVI